MEQLTFETLVVLLDGLVKESYTLKSPKDFERLFAALDALEGKCGAHYLLDAVRSALMLNRRAVAGANTEFVLHDKFRQQLGGLIMPGWKVVSRENDPRHLPDFWIQGAAQEVVPVEIKRDVFTQASLRQLQRYMSFYGCEKGLAAAPKLGCALPDNVLFLELGYDS